MKRLAWELLAELADDEAGVALARGSFVACLLTFVQPLTGASGERGGRRVAVDGAAAEGLAGAGASPPRQAGAALRR